MAVGAIREYLDKWVEVATRGRVQIEHSVLWSRMKMRCKVCDVIEVFDPPKDELTIDDSLKVFVNRHAHCTKPSKALDSQPVPVTADFKKVKPDQKWFGEEMMKPEIKKFSAEFNKSKSTEEELLKKAAKLQKENLEKKNRRTKSARRE